MLRRAKQHELQTGMYIAEKIKFTKYGVTANQTMYCSHSLYKLDVLA